MYGSQYHSHDGGPDGLIFQEPGQLVDASIEERIAGNGVTTLQWQGLTHHHVVVRSVRSTATNLYRTTRHRTIKKSDQIL